MKDDMKILAIIPARGGSKGIPDKNIRDFCGKPLIAHTIECAKKSQYVNRVIVSTDSEKIAEISKKYGAEVPFLRPEDLSQDKSKVVDAIAHLVDKLKTDEGYVPDYVVLLQTTSPLRFSSDIDAALLLCFKRNADAVVSLCSTEQLLYTKDENDRLVLVSSEEFLKSTNRQQLPPTYKLDGSMVYAIKTEVFMNKRTFLPENLVGYVIPRWRAVDLDEPQDFIIGEILKNNLENISSALINFK
jgi:N-acylneuraminate cytidylyltransferase/CMP-N,N'-diacetyllegionaminic acid synthase